MKLKENLKWMFAKLEDIYNDFWHLNKDIVLHGYTPETEERFINYLDKFDKLLYKYLDIFHLEDE